MNKLIGNIRITPNAGSGESAAHFEVVFVPFHGKVSARTVRIANLDDLTAFLIEIKISEDDASRWSGRARAGVVLIPNIERTEELLKEKGLLQ
jgi:hypothetical protein